MSVAAKRERILPRLIEKEMQDSFLDYSMSVIVQRALPDVRDGLKPVHRRILYAMHELGLRPDKAHKKSASVVGEVLGKYHPHGDTAVYDALVRMVQDFSLRYPLVDGQGNFGSIDGDSAAAYRYTEARLSSVAMELLDEIQKDTVRWEANFDDRLKEPRVLPGRIPNLLVNGSSGIAVGMSTNVPPHNLREVAEAVRLLVKSPECSLDDLMDKLPGPDFPTGGFIIGTEGIRKMYETGRGRVIMRGRIVTEALRGGKQQLVVTELPYATSKSRIIQQIAALSRKGGIPEVSDLRDESDRDGLRLVIELKRGADLKQVTKVLLKRTPLQSTFGAILLALDGGEQPREFNLKTLLERYRDHRLEVIQRRARHDLEKAEADLHLTQGLLLALAQIDEVVAVIRASKDRAQAAERLQDRFGLSELQADAILNMRLAKLTSLEQVELKAREKSLKALIKELKSLLNDSALQLQRLLEELDEAVERHGDARRTVILDADEADLTSVESGIADEDVVITFSHDGYVKRIPMHLYRRRINSGKALAGMERYEEDYLEKVSLARTQGWLLAFTRKGQAHFLRVQDVPEGSPASRGKSIYGLLNIDKNDPIVATQPVEDLTEDKVLIFVSEKGVVKRTKLEEFSNPRAGGVIATGVREDDGVLDVALSSGDQEVMLLSRGGRAIRFPETQVSLMGRTAQGVKGIQLRDNDQTIGLLLLRRQASLLTITDRGIGKRTPLQDFPIQKRGGLGTKAMSTSETSGPLISALEVVEGDQVMIVEHGGRVSQFAADSVKLQGRNTRGGKILDLPAGERIVEVTRAYSHNKGNGDSGSQAPSVEPGTSQFELLD
ncbi:MAG: DNA gyrase subunit A [Longimicrobiales bacterium]